MQVPQIVKNSCKKYVEMFKNRPEDMAKSYAWLAAGYCLCYAGMIYTVHQLEKKENALAEVVAAVDHYNAYMDGWSDGYRLGRDVNKTDDEN